jgi:hypothetical protein
VGNLQRSHGPWPGEVGLSPDDEAAQSAVSTERSPANSRLSQHSSGTGYNPLNQTYGHDHVAGDAQFADRPGTEVVGHTPEAVRAFLGTGPFDLGGRPLTIIDSPGLHRFADFSIVNEPRPRDVRRLLARGYIAKTVSRVHRHGRR